MTTATERAPPVATDRWTAWDRFVAAHPATGFMQSSWWAEFRTTTGYDYFGAVLRSGGAIAGGALVFRFPCDEGRCFYYIPEGPVLPDDEVWAPAVFDAVLGEIDARRREDDDTVSHLRIEPRWEHLPGFVRGFERVPAFRDAYMEPRDTVCIDLRTDEEAILAQMKPKGRYNIGVARRHGVTVVEETPTGGLDDFLAIYDDTATRQEFGAKPRSYFEDLAAHLSAPGRGAVFLARYEGKAIAAALVVYFGPRATYFFGGSLAAHRRVMAAHLLHFEIMRRAKALGHEWYDLWGVAPADARDHPWAGISAFKRKFGGVEVRLVPTLDHVYDREAYEAYRSDV